MKIEYPALPLARVGRDVWVPLEMLKSAELQMLPTPGSLTSSLLRISHDYDFKKNEPSINIIADHINFSLFGDNKVRYPRL